MKKERNANIEFLRILAMFFIVAGHFVVQNGLQGENHFDKFLVEFMSSGLRVAVNVFLLIGIWFMLDSKVNGKRILKIYIQTISYCWPLTLFSLFLFRNIVGVKDIARGLMPFLGRGLLFVSAYITLMLFSPFLNEILLWNKKKLSTFVALLMFFVSFISTIPDNQIAYVCDSMWFLVVYLFLGCYKKHYRYIKWPNWLNMLFGGGCTLYL